MVRPIGNGRAHPWHAGQLARHQVAERLAGDVDIALAVLDEIHRHVERVIDPALEAHAGLERPRQHARAIGIGVAPDFRAEGKKAVGLSFGERRIRKQRGRNWLQR